MARYIKTKYTGVFSQPSASRTHHGRPDQAWYIVYPSNGKRKWEKVGWASEGYTAAMANQLRAERIRSGREHTDLLTPESMTFSEAWETAWERHLKNIGSADDLRNRYQVHLLSPLANLPLLSITALDIERIRDGLMAKGRAAATVRHIVGLIGRVYNLMSKWGLYSGPSPAASVILPKADNRRSRYLTREEAAKLLGCLKSRSEYVWQLAMMSLYTGMRAKEVMTLKGEHISMETGRVEVRDTKKNHLNRVVYLTKALKEMLAGLDIRPGQLVFRRPKDGTYTGGVSHVFDRAVKGLGLNEGMTDRRDKVVFHRRF